MKGSLAFILVLASIGRTQAAEFSTGFGSEYNHATELSGQHEWTIDDPTPNLSFFVRLNGSDAAAFGGYYDVPSGSRATLSHPVGVPLAGASFRVSLAVLPSTSLYPGRDSFGWCLNDPEGKNLLALHFNPSASDPNGLDIKWSTGGGVPVPAGSAISYTAPYTLDLKFSSAGAVNLGFTATVTGLTQFSFTGSLPGLAGKVWNTVGLDFVVEDESCGDNFMVFDDLAAETLRVVDADRDGYSAEEEEWFGTSDDSSLSIPTPMLFLTGYDASLTFPSVVGNSYYIESSRDLESWTATLMTAEASSTALRVSEEVVERRFFRVRKP